MRGIDDKRMFQSIKFGRPNTGMKPFGGILKDNEIRELIAFIRHTFIEKNEVNILYHSPENQWYDFEEKNREAIAFFLFQGSEDELTDEMKIGRMLFDSSCVACHLVRKRSAPGEKAIFNQHLATEGD